MKIPQKKYGKIGPIKPLSYDHPESSTTFTGADLTAVAYVHNQLKVLGELQTVSYSIHRDKPAVMLLGRVNPPCFTRASRTIAGSLIFTVFDREVMEELIALYPDDTLDNDYSTLMIDQIPPFDITIQFVNEDGYLSSMVIYGVDIVDDGQVMSINDMIIENVKSFKARGIDLMYRKSAGVWTPARKVDPFARFEGLDPRKEKDTVSQYSDELKKILFDIDSATDQIHTLGADNIRYNDLIGEEGIDEDEMLGKIADNELEIHKLNAKITELTRREHEIRISLGFEERRKEIGLIL